MSPLRRLPLEVRTAGPGTTVDRLAERLGVTAAEVELMVEFWRRRGVVAVDDAGGCPGRGCGGCRLRCPGGSDAAAAGKLRLIRVTGPGG